MTKCSGDSGERWWQLYKPKPDLTWPDQLQDVAYLIKAAMDTWPAPSHHIAEQGRFWQGILTGYGITFNDNVTPGLAAHSWDYLAYLWLYTGATIIGALWPLYKYIPEEELLYPDYNFDEKKKDTKEPQMNDGNEVTGQNYYDFNDDDDDDNYMLSYMGSTKTDLTNQNQTGIPSNNNIGNQDTYNHQNTYNHQDSYNHQNSYNYYPVSHYQPPQQHHYTYKWG